MYMFMFYFVRFVLYSSDLVQAPYEDFDCYTGNCYATCGSIHQPEGIDANKKDVIVRDMYMKLSELPAKICKCCTELHVCIFAPCMYITIFSVYTAPEAERAYVFLQTLVIDQSTAFNASIFIRARQVIINYEVDPVITFDQYGVDLDYNITQAVTRGSI